MKDLFTTFKNVGKGGILTTEGIGIGLSTAKTLANVMGGFITVKSIEEVGTSITFALQMRNRRCSIDQQTMKQQNKVVKKLLENNFALFRRNQELQTSLQLIEIANEKIDKEIQVNNNLKLTHMTNCFKNYENGFTQDAGVLGNELANLLQIDAQFNEAKKKVIIDDLFDKVDFEKMCKPSSPKIAPK